MADVTPIKLRVTRWRCAYCTKSYSARRSAISHMETCPRDPAQHTCLTCRHNYRNDWDDTGCYLGLPMVWSEDCGKFRRVRLPNTSGEFVFGECVTVPPPGPAPYNIGCPEWTGRG